MKKYQSFFRLRFSMGLQYRVAAFAGIATQFIWGFLNIMAFHAFYRSNPSAYPMTMEATVSYIWMQQAFLALFMTWMMETELFDSIVNGSVAYELCRPLDIYTMWFFRSAATRLSRAVLRCMPILIVAAFLPKPYRLNPPASPAAFFWFLVTMLLGFLVTLALCMIVYILAFYTIHSLGLRMIFTSAADFLSGAVIPFPFFPDRIRSLLSLSPFAAMQNIPLRVYSADLTSSELWYSLALQIFWLILLILLGKRLYHHTENKIILQGG